MGRADNDSAGGRGPWGVGGCRKVWAGICHNVCYHQHGIVQYQWLSRRTAHPCLVATSRARSTIVDSVRHKPLSLLAFFVIDEYRIEQALPDRQQQLLTFDHTQFRERLAA